MRFSALFALSILAVAFRVDAADHSADKYVDYYYPAVTSEETFSRVIANAPPSTAAIRTNFVTSITKAQLEAPESPRFVIFEKGEESRNLIIVALDDEVFKTLFRARAVLAQLTSNMRGTDFFRQQNLHIEGTLYDMLMIMQFDSLVVTDGETWSHMVTFEPEN
jgi:hypothetical protein